MKGKEEAFVLTKGSKYRVVSLETREKPLVTHGVFKGYAAIGHDEGLCLELDESHKESAGRTRILPTHMILAIDVIESAEKKEETAKPDAMYI
ncbi:MAG: hypothetical protein ACE5IJ_07445 [Thermoplasmata archaeon]